MIETPTSVLRAVKTEIFNAIRHAAKYFQLTQKL